MILVFDPKITFIKLFQRENDVSSETEVKLRADYRETVVECFSNAKDAEAFGYFLYHGGEQVRESVSLISEDDLSEVERSIKFLPEYNELTYSIACYGIANFPEIPHILFCDTAFFMNLPVEASNYAVPSSLRREGIKRYGGFGIRHRWAWRQIEEVCNGATEKLISVSLGDLTNIAALENGRPVETTIGFSPVEGIPSSTGCGDIDPTIIFQLYSTGMSFAEISQLLARESGFSGLVGKTAGLTDILKNRECPKYNAVLNIFRYSVLKYIGAFVAVLGGVDTIVFQTERLEEHMGLIQEICHNLSFLELKLRKSPHLLGETWHLSREPSPIKVLCLEYNKCDAVTEEVVILLNRKGG